MLIINLHSQLILEEEKNKNQKENSVRYDASKQVNKTNYDLISKMIFCTFL